MRDTPDAFARRCLPLLLANQMGWAVKTQVAVEAEWNGGIALEALKVTTSPVVDHPPAVSHFGAGVLTWVLPGCCPTSSAPHQNSIYWCEARQTNRATA